MGSVCGTLTETMVETHRKRHLAYLMADHGALVNPKNETNLPKQQLNRYVIFSRDEVQLYVLPVVVVVVVCVRLCVFVF